MRSRLASALPLAPGLAAVAVVAIASLKSLVEMGARPVMLVVLETLFLAVLVLAVLKLA